jgi:hypothetical protein
VAALLLALSASAAGKAPDSKSNKAKEPAAEVSKTKADKTKTDKVSKTKADKTKPSKTKADKISKTKASNAKQAKADPSPKRAFKPRAKTIKESAAQRRQRTSSLLEVLKAGEVERTPAYHYANLTNNAAYEELEQRAIPFRRVEPGPSGVRAPIRLEGPLHGVSVHSTLPPEKRADSPYEVLDARLALALDDFCILLERHQVVELVHFTMYRAGASPAADSDHLPTRHPGGLAIDVGALRRRDGVWLDVGAHWKSDIGARTCGPGAKTHTGEQIQELIGLLCEAAEQRLFHYMLTPHYDRAHHDHLHLEIKPAVKWFLVT